jgi:hypothetical protein
MAQPAEAREHALHVARTYSAKAKAVCAERHLRDDQLRFLRAKEQQAMNQRKHANRAVRHERNAAVQLWTNEQELTRSLQSIKGKTARIAALRQQLTAYKHRHNAKDVRLSKEGKQLQEDELKSMLLPVIQRFGQFVTRSPETARDSAEAATSTQGVSASSLASTAAIARPQRKPRAKQQPKRTCEPSTPATNGKRVLQCCGGVDNAGDKCVQCDSCCQWFHCACEQVAWEAANSMAVYLCRMCLGELPPVE